MVNNTNQTKEAVVKKIEEVIAEIGFKGVGEQYSERGRRNPVRDDTQNLLTMAAAIKQPLRMLELGTAYGLSGLCLLRGAPKAELVTVEFDRAAADKARENFDRAGDDLRVVTLCGNADDMIEGIEGEFDILFLDHEKRMYLRNIKRLMERGNVTARTLVIADNVIDREAECRDFLDYMREYSYFQIIRTECGLLVAHF
jgi:predicted O-methyltransferase YrrM